MNSTKIVIKDLKKGSRATLKKHYILILFAVLISTFIGSEFSSFTSGLSFENPYKIKQSIQYTIFEDPVKLYDLINYMVDEKQHGYSVDMNAIIQQRLEEERKNPALGRTEGFLSTLVNAVEGGQIWSDLVEAVFQTTGSKNVTIILLIIAASIIAFIYWFFVRNIFTVVLSRILLEARVYEEVPVRKLLFPLHCPNILL